MLINLVALLWTPIAIVLGLIPIIFLLPTVILVKLPLRRRLKLVIPVWKFFGWFVMRVCFLSRIQHIDNRSKDSRLNTLQSGLYICNHLSYADVPMTLIFFQIPTVMKKEVLYIPLIGQLARASGSMPFDRSTGDSRKQIFELCKTRLLDNLPVQYYPEGTRNKNTPKSPKDYEHIKLHCCALLSKKRFLSPPFHSLTLKKFLINMA
jgi:1-acyl-sn-glycerol-3-phosphate acyltransferase